MLKKERLVSASFMMNLLSAATWPVNFCTSFLVCRGCIWIIAIILSGGPRYLWWRPSNPIPGLMLH
jgi:hypothetical protein